MLRAAERSGTLGERLAEISEDTTDPAVWGVNWPKQYDSYRRTAITTRTRFGGHGGSEALPAEKIERDPWLQRMFLGYAFAIDYRDRRGHAEACATFGKVMLRCLKKRWTCNVQMHPARVAHKFF